MTAFYMTPEDYDRVPEDDEIQEADSFCQTNRSYLDMLPYLLSGDSDDLDQDFDSGYPC